MTMALKSDRDGFLIGERLDGGDEKVDATDLLREIRDGVDGVGDAIGSLANRLDVGMGRALKAAIRAAEPAARAGASVGAWRAGREPFTGAIVGSAARAAIPRRTFEPHARNALGQFVSARPATEPQKAVELGPRAADGRFTSRGSAAAGAGSKAEEARRVRESTAGARVIGDRVAAGLRAAVKATPGAVDAVGARVAGVDPTIEAFKDIGGGKLLGKAVSGLGAMAVRAIEPRGRRDREPGGTVRRSTLRDTIAGTRLYRLLTGMRGDAKAATKAEQKQLKAIANKDTPGASGGGMLTTLFGLLLTAVGGLVPAFLKGIPDAIGAALKVLIPGLVATMAKMPLPIPPIGGGKGVPGLPVPAGGGPTEKAPSKLSRLGKLAGVAGRATGWLAVVAGLAGIYGAVTSEADPKLSDEENRANKFKGAGGSAGLAAGGLAGAGVGAAVGSVLGPLGTLLGWALGGYVGSLVGEKAGERAGGAAAGLGSVSRSHESGGRAGAIGKDRGGNSYGTYQLSSGQGVVQDFLKVSGHGAQFKGLEPGTKAFDDKWKAMAADPAFGQAQHDYVKSTHYDPTVAKLKAGGIDLSGKGKAVQEALFSTGVQFGPGGAAGLIGKALKGMDTAKATDLDIVDAIQKHKVDNNATLFKSSPPSVQADMLRRSQKERMQLADMAVNVTGAAGMPAGVATAPMPRAPATMSSIPWKVPAMPDYAVPAAPLNTQRQGPIEVISRTDTPQQVQDRTVAQVVSGGLGWHN